MHDAASQSDDPLAAAPRFLFVYGTLKSSFSNPSALALRRAAALVGPASLGGRMFLVSGPRGSLRYPAAVPPAGATGVVRGELYEIHNPRVLQRLDAYEGCAPESPKPHEYRRAVVQVTTDDGSVVDAIVYWYARDWRGLTPILSGEFQ